MSTGGKPDHPGLLEDTTRSGLEVAWQERVAEAEVLLQAGYPSLGICLKVYALEARLKLRICELLALEYLPRVCKTHDLGELILIAGLWGELSEPGNSPIKESFLELVQFSKAALNHLRYQPQANMTAKAAADLLIALDDPIEGVFPWLVRSL